MLNSIFIGIWNIYEADSSGFFNSKYDLIQKNSIIQHSGMQHYELAY